MIFSRRKKLKCCSGLLLGFFCISLLWLANQNVVYPSSSQSSTNYQIRVSTNMLSGNQYVSSRIDSNRPYHVQLTELTVYQNLPTHRMVRTNPSYENQIAFRKAFVPPLNSYTPHSPISIVNDTDFANQALAESWLGNGSSNNPYRIENYTIDQANAADDCIRIFNTTVHFIIQNCYVGNTTGPHAGILLEQTIN
ncbi:MAG: hypothetical protein ACFFC7_08140, partial [Candidatus Hermodarchaeota archaeon]